MEVQLSKKNIMKRNGQGEEKVHAPYGAKDILLLTSARLRRTFFRKMVKSPYSTHLKTHYINPSDPDSHPLTHMGL